MVWIAIAGHLKIDQLIPFFMSVHLDCGFTEEFDVHSSHYSLLLYISWITLHLLHTMFIIAYIYVSNYQIFRMEFMIFKTCL